MIFLLGYMLVVIIHLLTMRIGNRITVIAAWRHSSHTYRIDKNLARIKSIENNLNRGVDLRSTTLRTNLLPKEYNTKNILGINVNAMPMLMHMNAKKIKQQILHMQPIETKVSPKA